MKKEEFEFLFDESNFDEQRRDAFKKLGLLGGAPLLAGASTEVKASSVKSSAKIVIVGGGAAGLTIAARLDRAMDNPNVTIIEPNPKHVYQAGHTLVGGGIIDPNKLIVDTVSYIPESSTWEQTTATDIDPDARKVTLANNKVLDYDILVVCTGFQYDWKKIEGLDASMIGKNGINSIYTLDGAVKTWENIQAFSKTGGEAIFTHPNTPIKCGGAPKKCLYLMDDYLRQQNAREKANISFVASSGKLFQVPVFEEAIKGHFKDRDINHALSHHLVKIDEAKKEATFKTVTIKKGEWDDILEEYAEIEEETLVTKKYDFIHIPPPMSAPDFLKNSKVAWQKGKAADLGLIEVDKHTLQHKRYKNIFSLGDVAGTPIGKTGGTVRKQAPIVVQNILDVLSGKEPTQKFDGYTVCPIITRYGKVMLAEFDYDLKPTPTIPGLAVEEERWMWWVMKVHILEPMYFYGMLRGLA